MNIVIQNHTIIEIVPYSESVRTDWERFVSQEAINSTFLHSRAFFDHNLLNAKDDSSLLFYKGGKVIAIFPAILYVENSKRILHSHLRATYGGFIISNKIGVEAAVNIVKQTISFAKEKNVDQIIVRNPFRIFNSELCDETDYAMWLLGFKIKSRELEFAIKLFEDISRCKSQYHNDVRRNVKKAHESIEVSHIENLKEFWMLLEQSLWIRHRKKPIHDYNTIVKLIEAVGKDKILAFGAYHNQKLIGGCLIFIANSRVLHGQYIADDLNFRYLKPVHALIDHTIEYGCKNGYSYFNLGMANEDEGTKINYGLLTLKEHFGGRGSVRETMYLNI